MPEGPHLEGTVGDTLHRGRTALLTHHIEYSLFCQGKGREEGEGEWEGGGGEWEGEWEGRGEWEGEWEGEGRVVGGMIRLV